MRRLLSPVAPTIIILVPARFISAGFVAAVAAAAAAAAVVVVVVVVVGVAVVVVVVVASPLPGAAAASAAACCWRKRCHAQPHVCGYPPQLTHSDREENARLLSSVGLGFASFRLRFADGASLSSRSACPPHPPLPVPEELALFPGLPWFPGLFLLSSPVTLTQLSHSRALEQSPSPPSPTTA